MNDQALTMDEEDRRRFFSQPEASADLEYWSKMSYWSLEEAVALSFGKNPGIVNWKTVKEYLPPRRNASPFAKEYERRRKLVSRAKDCCEPYRSDTTTPHLFLAWAKKLDIPTPQELQKQVDMYGDPTPHWSEKNDELKEECGIENNEKKLTQSPYWRSFVEKTEKPIKEYPEWKGTVMRVQKTENLHDWVKENTGASDREAAIIKKTLSDFFKELS